MIQVYISFHAPINEHTTQQLLGVTFQQLNEGATEIVYLISTPGGAVSSGIALYNTIKGLPINTIMHNVGNIDSIGNAVFLAGKERVACKHATFMFHGVGFDTPAGLRLERKDLNELLDGIESDEAKMGGIISDETTLTPKEINGLFVEASTKNSDFSLTSGIVHEIREVNIPEGIPVIQLVF